MGSSSELTPAQDYREHFCLSPDERCMDVRYNLTVLSHIYRQTYIVYFVKLYLPVSPPETHYHLSDWRPCFR